MNLKNSTFKNRYTYLNMKISSWLVSLCQLLGGIMKFLICLFLRVRQREVGIRNFFHFFLLFLLVLLLLPDARFSHLEARTRFFFGFVLSSF